MSRGGGVVCQLGVFTLPGGVYKYHCFLGYEMCRFFDLPLSLKLRLFKFTCLSILEDIVEDN